MTATLTKIPDETPIDRVVTAPRPLKHLIAAGITTLGDVRSRGLEEVFAVKFVGIETMQQLSQAIGVQSPEALREAAPKEEPEFEESGMPLQLERLPTGPSHLAFIPAHKIPGPGGAGHQVQQSVFIEFDSKGRAEITARMYFMRKFRRDVDRADAAIDESRPWRQECVDMLRRHFSAYGCGFIILTD